MKCSTRRCNLRSRARKSIILLWGREKRTWYGAVSKKPVREAVEKN